MGVYIKGVTKAELEDWLYIHDVIWDSRDFIDIPEPHGRLIDGDVLLEESMKDGSFNYVDSWQIADSPTADVVEVVYCKDCKYYDELVCPLNTLEKSNGTGFCNRGERRE